MKIFIFEQVRNLTNEYHKDGGLIIIEEDLESALNLAESYEDPASYRTRLNPIKLSPEEIKNVITYEVSANEPKLFIFPNSGCC